MFQGNAGGGTGGEGGTASSGAFGKLAFSKLKTDPSKKDSMDEMPSGKDELEALADSEAEDPIVKAEREFFEIIKQVCSHSYKH